MCSSGCSGQLPAVFGPRAIYLYFNNNNNNNNTAITATLSSVNGLARGPKELILIIVSRRRVNTISRARERNLRQQRQRRRRRRRAPRGAAAPWETCRVRAVGNSTVTRVYGVHVFVATNYTISTLSDTCSVINKFYLLANACVCNIFCFRKQLSIVSRSKICSFSSKNYYRHTYLCIAFIKGKFRF